MFLVEKVKQYRKVPKESENFSLPPLPTHNHSLVFETFFLCKKKKVYIYQHRVPDAARFKLIDKCGSFAPHSLYICSFIQHVFIRYLPWAGHQASQ